VCRFVRALGAEPRLDGLDRDPLMLRGSCMGASLTLNDEAKP